MSIEVNRQIIAIGGGRRLFDKGVGLKEYLLNLIPKSNPSICLMPHTRLGSSDYESYITNFKRKFEACCATVSIIRLSGGVNIQAIASKLLESDLIYVCGGSPVTLMGVWKAWGS